MKKEWVKSVVLVVLGALIYSVGTQYFVVPAQIAPGGRGGHRSDDQPPHRAAHRYPDPAD